MTYSVSSGGWIGPVLMTMGAVHLALADWPQLVTMGRRGWWATADDAASGQAVGFAVAGGALLGMGSFATTTGRAGGRTPRLAAMAFTATMMAAFTATTSPGAGLGVAVGAAMCRDAFRAPAR